MVQSPAFVYRAEAPAARARSFRPRAGDAPLVPGHQQRAGRCAAGRGRRREPDDSAGALTRRPIGCWRRRARSRRSSTSSTSGGSSTRSPPSRRTPASIATGTTTLPAAFARGDAGCSSTTPGTNGPTLRDAAHRRHAPTPTPTWPTFYGYPLPAQPGFQPIALDPDACRRAASRRAAFLATHAKANQTSPVQRGKFVRERLLLRPAPPPRQPGRHAADRRSAPVDARALPAAHRRRRLRRLPPADGSHRLRVRALRRHRPLARRRRRQAGRRHRRPDRHRRRRRSRRRAQPGARSCSKSDAGAQAASPRSGSAGPSARTEQTADDVCTIGAARASALAQAAATCAAWCARPSTSAHVPAAPREMHHEPLRRGAQSARDALLRGAFGAADRAALARVAGVAPRARAGAAFPTRFVVMFSPERYAPGRLDADRDRDRLHAVADPVAAGAAPGRIWW